jgi:hypothetical protein
MRVQTTTTTVAAQTTKYDCETGYFVLTPHVFIMEESTHNSSLAFMDVDALPDDIFGVDSTYLDHYLKSVEGLLLRIVETLGSAQVAPQHASHYGFLPARAPGAHVVR